MESQRRLRAYEGVWLTTLFTVLTLVACDADEPQSPLEMGGTGEVAQGIDPFCATRPKIEFCEDFDTDGLPGAFDDQTLDSSTMVIDSDEASSLPNSLLISVESGGSAALRHQFQAGGKLRLFGMLYVSELGAGDVEIGAFELGDYRVSFGASEDGSLWGSEGGERRAGNGSLPVGRWASFRWDVNIYDDGSGTANLRFGFDTIVDMDDLSPPAMSGARPIAQVGLSEATGAWTMRLDTITVAVEEASQ